MVVETSATSAAGDVCCKISSITFCVLGVAIVAAAGEDEVATALVLLPPRSGDEADMLGRNATPAVAGLVGVVMVVVVVVGGDADVLVVVSALGKGGVGGGGGLVVVLQCCCCCFCC